MSGKKTIKPLTWTGLLVLFGVPTLLNLLACQWAIPWLDANTAWPIEAGYFLSVGGLVLAPMFFAALVMSGREAGSFGIGTLLARMRVKPLTGGDWLWTVTGFVGLCLASLIIAKFVMPAFGMAATPFFFQNMPLDDAHRWLLYVWPLFFFFNIFGEEFLWRGYILPRQELLNGKGTWAVHGALWAIWHLPMGLNLVVSALPTLFILPAIVQWRKNTSISILIHTIFGAMGFLVLAFGLVG